jgi:signal peptidase I
MARSIASRSGPEGKSKAPAAAPSAPPSKSASKESHRETVEAVAVAFILALLVRTFEAEAFVIPTGSMAPTLMGRHKDVTCPQCNFVYTVNAADESEGVSGGEPYSRRIATGICVNCRFQARVAADPTFKGDRILVMKFPYDLPSLPGASEPRRWDVVVFRYPEEPETSYIKRLVGLPGETLRIWHGDIFIQPPGGSAFQLQRKSLVHQRAMQMAVYDDAHRAAALKDRPEWRRWGASTSESWSEDATDPGTYRINPTASVWAEMRYRHLVPDPVQWRAIEDGETPSRPPTPSLITDFYSYNTGLYADNSDLTGPVSRDQESAWLQPHWVGDLTLGCRVTPESATGSLRFELIEGGVSNRCEIDLQTGQAVLTHGDTILGRATTNVSWQAPHDVEFANVDNRLTLWLDGRPVFGDGVTYDSADEQSAHPSPTIEDLAPARVAGSGAKVSVSGLVLKRDIYYTVNPQQTDYGSSWDQRVPKTPVELAKLLADPEAVAALGPLPWVDYRIREDNFLMLGDNSPRSKDSRGWRDADRAWDPEERQPWEVPRKLITGKAFCVYWPHGKPFGLDIRVMHDFRVPFRPYFERMKLIH